MALAWSDAVEALKPLRVRAHQLQNQAAQDYDTQSQRWKQSEKPVLKEHAAGLKNVLQVLIKEEQNLAQRIANLTTSAVPNHPGTTTGFNVIRARTDAEGEPLSTTALRQERDRLLKAFDAMEIHIAEAKAEITKHGRHNEEEIWETKLVALQDTKRVYREEINLIEVELLGREHYERIEHDRRQAEESGTAQLRRIQEQFIQTRTKFNRAKQQYYFPALKGYNITFGGGGIYGACKDIVICEINGALTLKAEPGEKRPDGTVKPARMIVQFEAASQENSFQRQQRRSNSNKHRQQEAAATTSSRPDSSISAAEAAQRSVSAPNLSVGGGPSRSPAGGNMASGKDNKKLGSIAEDTTGAQQPGLVKRAATFSGAHNVGATNTNTAAASGGAVGSARTVAHSSLTKVSPLPSPKKNASSGGASSLEGPSPAAGLTRLSPSIFSTNTTAANLDNTTATPGNVRFAPIDPNSKGKGFASKFLKRLGSKKEKFQGNQLSQLQPAAYNEVGPASKNQKRSLASKLLSRKGMKHNNSGLSNSDMMDPSINGGMHGLSLDEGRGTGGLSGYRGNASSYLGESLEDTASLRSGIAISERDDDDDTDILGGEDQEHLQKRRQDYLQGREGSSSPEKAKLQQEGIVDDEDDNFSTSSGSLDDDDFIGDDTGAAMPSPLTKEALQQASRQFSADGRPGGFHGASERGSWLRNNTVVSGHSGGGGGGGGGANSAGMDAASVLDDGSSSIVDFADTIATDVADGELAGCKGVFVTGRLKGFDLVGERGTKVPNLTIGEADVRATVFVRFVFEYTPSTGWVAGHLPEDKPRFHVENLSYRIRGNNVPMPPTLIKHILRVAIPGLIQRRLLGIMPKEFGDYLLMSECGFAVKADVGCIGPSLDVLDADLGFEVQGPARSADGAKQQQRQYEAAKKARALLGLTLPQAQILAEIFNGGAALMDPPRPVSISELIAFKAKYERHPVVYKQLCGIIDTAYNLIAEGRNIDSFSFPTFMATSLARLRRKPAKAKVVMRDADVNLNVDAIITAIHDFTQRTIEEMVIKGPLAGPQTSLDEMREALGDELGVLHAWHAFVLRELQHFKSKFRGGAGTLLAGADRFGFSAGVENCFYEGPLRLRLPVAMQLDQDGAFSFEAPLPSPQGKLGLFVDMFKALTVPSHVRPPAQAVNWIEITGDPEVDFKMQRQVERALDLIQEVLDELTDKIVANNLHLDDADPYKVLTTPRTAVGDRLGRFIVNRLKVRVRLDERRIGEILSGLDPHSMGEEAFNSTAGRIIGHLGDVMTLAFTPAAADVEAGSTAAPTPCSDRYLFQLESSDVSRLRADVQSLGFQSAISPGGAVRLVHALVRAALFAFKERPEEELSAFRERMQGWYQGLTREALDISLSLDTKGVVAENGDFVVSLNGTADDAHLRATSPLMVANELDLVPLGKAMRGDPPQPTQQQ